MVNIFTLSLSNKNANTLPYKGCKQEISPAVVADKLRKDEASKACGVAVKTTPTNKISDQSWLVTCDNGTSTKKTNMRKATRV